MAFNNSIIPFIQSEFPSLYQTEGQRLIDFIIAYYAYMEDGEDDFAPLDVITNFLSNNNIDLSTDTFLNFIRAELTPGIPNDIEGDTRFVTKRILDIFEHLGNISSLRLLFRILYNREIEIRRPGDIVLRASAGNWIRRDTITILGANNVPVTGMRVQGIKDDGEASRFRADVQDIRQEDRFGIAVTVLLVDNVKGDFDNAITHIHTIKNSANVGEVYKTVGPLSDVDITITGSGHSVGDLLDIEAISGVDATGIVRSVSELDSLNFTITDRGFGYRFDQASQTAGDYTGIIDVNIADVGQTTPANFRVTSVINTQDIRVPTEIISGVGNVMLGDMPFGNTGNIDNNFVASAMMAAANINTRLEDAFNVIIESIGSIGQIESIDSGQGYPALPAITVRDPVIAAAYLDGTGENAIITPNFNEGPISDLDIIDSGRAYAQGEIVTIVNTTATNTANAEGVAEVSGYSRDIGRYENQRGWLSGEDRLHDGDYYQKHSFVVCSDQPRSRYERVLSEIFIPVGSKMFSEAEILKVTSRQIITDEVGYLEGITGAANFKESLEANEYRVVISNNTANTVADFWDNTVASKRIKAADISHVIERNNWANNTLYNQYSGPTSFGDYIINENNEVFKCLDNNMANTSIVEPLAPTSTGIWVPQYLRDGYVWKYLYKIDNNNKFLVYHQDPNWIPSQVLEHENESDQWIIQSNAIDGSLEHIIVDDAGIDYVTYSGTLQPDSTQQFSTTSLELEEVPTHDIDDYTILITAGIGVNERAQIQSSSTTSNTITIAPALTREPDENTRYIIAPTLTIVGSATSHANGFVEVSESAGIERVIIPSNEVGAGYTSALATITGATGSGAVLSVPLPPTGGHGSNAVSEIVSDNIMIVSDFNGTEDNTIDASGEFRSYAIIRDPIYRSEDLRAFDVHDLTTRLQISSGEAMEDLWTANSVVIGSTTETTGRVVSFANTNFDHTQGILRLSAVSANGFATTDTITTSIGDVAATITGITDPDISGGSIVYRDNFDPMSRHPLQNDRIRTVVTF